MILGDEIFSYTVMRNSIFPKIHAHTAFSRIKPDLVISRTELFSYVSPEHMQRGVNKTKYVTESTIEGDLACGRTRRGACTGDFRVLYASE